MHSSLFLSSLELPTWCRIQRSVGRCRRLVLTPARGGCHCCHVRVEDSDKQFLLHYGKRDGKRTFPLAVAKRGEAWKNWGVCSHKTLGAAAAARPTPRRPGLLACLQERAALPQGIAAKYPPDGEVADIFFSSPGLSIDIKSRAKQLLILIPPSSYSTSFPSSQNFLFTAFKHAHRDW